MNRTCSKCGLTKHIDCFSKDKKGKFGRRSQCKKCMSSYLKKWRANNPDYYSLNAQQSRVSAKQSRARNRASNIKRNRLWKKNNPEKVRAYFRKKYANDPLYKLSMTSRRRINHALNKTSNEKRSTTGEIIGCSFDDLRCHIESLFKEGMSWSNYGEWEVDHVKPLASATTEDELLSLCHYTNLQPLWKRENRAKWANLPERAKRMEADNGQ